VVVGDGWLSLLSSVQFSVFGLPLPLFHTGSSSFSANASRLGASFLLSSLSHHQAKKAAMQARKDKAKAKAKAAPTTAEVGVAAAADAPAAAEAGGSREL